ncbi:MAG: T9SS type A sorting domain-containing protein [Bacteroidia bacterium]
MKMRIFICGLCLSSLGKAQIVIDQNDYFQFGNEYYRSFINFGLDTVNLENSAGENQFWDFSWLERDFTDTLRIIKADLSPFGNEFPEADFGISSNQNNFFYEELNSDGVAILGRVNYDPIFDFNVVYRFNSTGNAFVFPMEYNDSYNFGYSYNVQYPAFFPGTDSVRQFNSSYFELNVDGWGTLAMPNGNFEVLRLKQVAYLRDTVSVYDEPGGWGNTTIGIDTTVTWLFFAKDIGYRLLSFTQRLNGSGKLVNWVKDYLLSDGVKIPTAEFNVYPQPANNKLFVKHDEDYKYQIVDMQGKLLSEGLLAKEDAYISTSELQSGMYVLKLSNYEGQNFSARKVLINQN